MSRRTPLVAFLLLAAFSAPLAAQEHEHHLGTEQLGTVHFPTSCRAESAPMFDRGVALLHSFEFGASIRPFNEVLAADSTCAMAYWGIALSRWSNPMSAAIRPVALLQSGLQAVSAARRMS